MKESSASRRYGHREDCTLLFDLEPLFVVEVQDSAHGTSYIVGDKFDFFTTRDKPILTEKSIKDSLIDYKAERMEKIREDTETTGLEYL
jgi:hypothetical protein